MTLTEFLTARLDEVEETAQYSGPARVAWLTYLDNSGQMHYTTVAAGDDYSPWITDGHELPEPASARVVYDPARVLRDVEAGRKLLAAYHEALAALTAYESYDGEWAGTPEEWAETGVRLRHVADVLHRQVKIRAAVWGDHSDYLQEWSPAK